MSFPASTNVDGSNPGPNSSNSPDTTQSSIGNIWKTGLFSLALTPVAVAASTTAEQTFAATGIGLQVGDFVSVVKPSAQAGLCVVGARVSAVDTLALTYANVPVITTYSSALTPAAVSANTTAEQTFTVTGLAPGQDVFVNKPSAQAGLGIVNARVSAVDTLAITYVNATAGSLTPTAETYGVVAVSSASITPTAETYLVKVDRVQPNWTKPASGNQFDF